MNFKEFRDYINDSRFDHCAEQSVVDGRGELINFIVAIDMPDPEGPTVTAEELSDPFYMGPKIAVVCIDAVTDKDLQEVIGALNRKADEDTDESIREAPDSTDNE